MAGRRRKFRIKHSKRPKGAGLKNPKQVAAAVGRRRTRRVRGR